MRVGVALAVLLVCGLLAATLVRMAPGFGMDERMLDVRLGSGSLTAIERQGTQQVSILHYYWQYLRQLSQGDLGNSLSYGRPVRDLLSERLGLSLRSALAGQIDRLTRLQSTLLDENRRKALFDRVQQIAWDEAPFLYLVNRNALVAAARSLRNVEPSALRPNILWNVERLWIDPTK